MHSLCQGCWRTSCTKAKGGLERRQGRGQGAHPCAGRSSCRDRMARMGLVRSRNWLLTVPEAGRPGSGWHLVSEGLFQVLPAGGGKGALQALSLGTSPLMSPPDDLTASHRPHCPTPSCWRKDSNVWALRGRQHSHHSSHGGQPNRMAKAGPGGGHVPHAEAPQTALTTWLRAHLSGRLP